MFRVVFFVDDRKLGDAVRSLAGLAIGNPEVQPVVNAEKGANGTLKALTGGTVAEQFIAYLRKTKAHEVRVSDAQAFLKSIGRSKGSATYMLMECVKAHVLSRRGKGTATVYTVRG